VRRQRASKTLDILFFIDRVRFGTLYKTRTCKMKRLAMWNTAGAVIFLLLGVVLVVLLWENIGDIAEYFPLGGLIALSFVFVGAERWLGEKAWGVMAVSLLWVLFWAFGSVFMFEIASVIGLVSRGAETTTLITSYLLGSFFFVLLMFSNLFRFFNKLFSLPRFGSNS